LHLYVAPESTSLHCSFSTNVEDNHHYNTNADLINLNEEYEFKIVINPNNSKYYINNFESGELNYTTKY